MKALVIYDSTYGNTEKIAHAIGRAIDAQVLRVGNVNPDDLQDFDLVIVGSPPHGGFPTEGIHELAKTASAFEGIDVAAFDTRTATIWNRILPFGYAASKIARNLEGSGGNFLALPEGFVVLGIKGLLTDGELARAADWAKRLIS
jgi:flavodoxin